jgi:hypothetical protein
MSFGSFDRPKGNILSQRIGTPDPARYAKLARRAEQDRADRLYIEDHPTVLSLPDQLKKSGRFHLLGKDPASPAVDRALLEDLLKSPDAKQADRLRRLSLAAANGGFPGPKEPLGKVRSLVLHRKAEVLDEAAAKRAVSDDTENEENATTQWNQLVLLLDSRYDPLADPRRREEAVRFLEETLSTQYFFLDNSGHRGLKEKMLERLEELKRIRNAVYFRLLHPEARFPTE